jgi:hypothetical protein
MRLHTTFQDYFETIVDTTSLLKRFWLESKKQIIGEAIQNFWNGKKGRGNA